MDAPHAKPLLDPFFIPSPEVNPIENASLRSREEIKAWYDVRDSVQQVGKPLAGESSAAALQLFK
jgi:hypothetical protein